MCANLIKLVAVIFMIGDHVGWRFPLPDYAEYILHTLGAAAAPVMFFFVGEGVRYTADIKRYTLRLLAFAALSEPAYLLFTKGAFKPLNVMFTLALSVMAIRVLKGEDHAFIKYIYILGFLLLGAFCDWGPVGIVIALVFYTFGRFKALFIYLVLNLGQWLIAKPHDLWSFMGSVVSGMTVVALILMYNKKRGSRRLKYLFYTVYPLQFLLFLII